MWIRVDSTYDAHKFGSHLEIQIPRYMPVVAAAVVFYDYQT